MCGTFQFFQTLRRVEIFYFYAKGFFPGFPHIQNSSAQCFLQVSDFWQVIHSSNNAEKS